MSLDKLSGRLNEKWKFITAQNPFFSLYGWWREFDF